MKAVTFLGLFALSGVLFAQQGPMMPKGGQVDAKKFAAAEKSYKAAKMAYGKKPKDAKLKKAYVDSTVAFGLANMYSATLPAREKYKFALVYFREALKIDPKNKLAKEQMDLIVSIYKQMGRPVPN